METLARLRSKLPKVLKRTGHYNTFNRYRLFACKWFAVYVHVYFEETELSYHTHPWTNLTVRLWGRFVESTITNFHSFGEQGPEKTALNPRFAYRHATTAHKMKALNMDTYGPLITLFITGQNINPIGGRA